MKQSSQETTLLMFMNQMLFTKLNKPLDSSVIPIIIDTLDAIKDNFSPYDLDFENSLLHSLLIIDQSEYSGVDIISNMVYLLKEKVVNNIKERSKTIEQEISNKNVYRTEG